MKKIALIAAIAMVAGVASADLAVDWKNSTGAVAASDGGSDWLVGSKIDLIWSLAGAQTTGGTYDLLLAGEYVLDTGVTVGTSFWSGLGGIYDNAAIGGNDVNSGFFFTRIYENNGSGGEYFLDIAMGDGASFVYDAGNPTTTYSDSVVSGANWIGQNGTQVVPEPSTIGLMGIAGLGLFVARRKSRR